MMRSFLAAAVLAFSVGGFAQAADTKANPKGSEASSKKEVDPGVKMFQAADADKNGMLDPKEMASVRTELKRLADEMKKRGIPGGATTVTRIKVLCDKIEAQRDDDMQVTAEAFAKYFADVLEQSQALIRQVERQLAEQQRKKDDQRNGGSAAESKK